MVLQVKIMTLQTAYFLLGLFVTFLLLFIGRQAIYSSFGSRSNQKFFILLAGILGWHLYTWLMTKTGLLQDFNSFPPKFFIFLILPAFIFTGIFISKNKNNTWIQNIPPHGLIYIQTYRILIESLFVVSLVQEILPPQVTIEGYNFDMIFAMSAPVVAFLFQRKLLSVKVILLWNYLGLVIIFSIIILFMTSIYLPHLYKTDTYISTQFAAYPYVLVAGFLMPAAVFLHVLSIAQLKRLKP